MTTETGDGCPLRRTQRVTRDPGAPATGAAGAVPFDGVPKPNTPPPPGGAEGALRWASGRNSRAAVGTTRTCWRGGPPIVTRPGIPGDIRPRLSVTITTPP